MEFWNSIFSSDYWRARGTDIRDASPGCESTTAWLAKNSTHLRNSGPERTQRKAGRNQHFFGRPSQGTSRQRSEEGQGPNFIKQIQKARSLHKKKIIFENKSQFYKKWLYIFSTKFPVILNLKLIFSYFLSLNHISQLLLIFCALSNINFQL